MAIAHTLARVRQMRLSEIPFRLSERLVHLTDPLTRRRRAMAGPAPRWPWPVLVSHEVWVPNALGWPVVDPLDWRRDPRSGARWPAGPSHRIDLLGSGLDPRFAWEWSRLQHAALLAECNDPRGAAHARAFVEDNPPGMGLAWSCALEAALRLVSLVRIGAREEQPWIRAAVTEHADWIVRHPSRGSSSGNHRVAELTALSLAGLSLGERRYTEAARELPAVLGAQIHGDGVGVEQSVHYLAFDLEWAILAHQCGLQGLEEPISRAARLLCALLPPSGLAPNIGDSDDGRVLAMSFDREERYVHSVTGAACALLGQPAPAGYRLDARALALGITEPSGTEARARSQVFPEGGLTVLSSDGIHVVFDHGPLGGCVLAAHAHADALSVWIDAGGPVVCARGTGQYNAAPAARRFHRGSSAHPTAVIDGRDQSAPHGSGASGHPFLWRSRAHTTLVRADLAQLSVTARSEHATAEVSHTRTVSLRDKTVSLIDEISAVGRHHIAILLPLSPDITVSPDLVLSRRGSTIGRVSPDPSCAVSVVHGGQQPGLGWHSPSYGRWVPASAIICERHAKTPVTLRTTIALW